MTQPALATSVRKMGRMYPSPKTLFDPSALPLNRWGSVDPENLPDGAVMLPSVTNVNGVLHKNLVGYGGEHAIRAGYEEGWPEDVEDAVSKYKWAANKHRDKRAEAGTRAHTLAERLTIDAPLPKHISEEDEKFADAFMAWWTKYDVEPVFTEQTVAWVDPTNPQVGYAGTADGFGYLRGHEGLTVYDFKSKAGAPDDKKINRYGLGFEENRLQLAALAQAQWRFVCEDGEWTTDVLPVVAGGMVVALYESGEYRTEYIHQDSLVQAGAAFLGLLTMRRYQLGFDVAAEVGW